jgi:hypothetical protein
VIDRARSPWHRDDLPAWAWAAFAVMRVAQVVAALVPVALVVLLWWTWSHRHDPPVKRALQGAARQAAALADSVRSMGR